MKFPPLHRPSFAVFLGFSAFYLAQAARGFVGGDHILLTFVGQTGGYAHAPGYPIFSALCTVFTHVLPLPPVWAASAGTAVLGALSVALLVRALEAWRVGREGAVLGAVFFGLIPHVAFMHTQSEVFALNHVFVAALLWITAPRTWRHPERGAAAMAALAGLALAHHHTAVFLAPVGLWAWSRAVKASSNRWRAFGLSVLALVAGLFPYAYLVFVAAKSPAPWHWGDPSTLRGLVRIFLREDFGTFSMTVAQGEERAGLWTQWVFLANETVKAFLAGGLVFVAAGVRKMHRDHISGAHWFGAAVLSAGPIFVALFHRAPQGLDRLLVQKFHLMFFLLLAFLMGLGIDALLHRRGTRAAAALLCAMNLGVAVWTVDELQDPAPAMYIADLWAPLEPNAVLLASGDHTTAGSWQYLAEHRPGSFTVAVQLLAHGWYRDQVNAALDVKTVDTGVHVNLIEFIDAVHARQRPVYISEMFTDTIAKTYPTVPHGLAIRVYPRGTRPEHPMQVAAKNAQIYDGFLYDGPKNHWGEWSAILPPTYARTWVLLGGAFESMGETTAAQQAKIMAQKYEVGP